VGSGQVNSAVKHTCSTPASAPGRWKSRRGLPVFSIGKYRETALGEPYRDRLAIRNKANVTSGCGLSFPGPSASNPPTLVRLPGHKYESFIRGSIGATGGGRSPASVPMASAKCSPQQGPRLDLRSSHGDPVDVCVRRARRGSSKDGKPDQPNDSNTTVRVKALPIARNLKRRQIVRKIASEEFALPPPRWALRVGVTTRPDGRSSRRRPSDRYT